MSMRTLSFSCPVSIIQIVEKGIEKGEWSTVSDALRDIVRKAVRLIKFPFMNEEDLKCLLGSEQKETESYEAQLNSKK